MAFLGIKFTFIGVLFIILSTNPCLSLLNCGSRESEALLSFKETLNASEGILNSWVNGSDCCSKWDGISCNNFTYHVEVVNLSSYNDQAEQLHMQSEVISATVCKLPFLKHLNLRSIGITGIIPSCLGNLSHLQYLNIKNNSLSGNLPPAICRLSNLSSIDVSYNQLTGVIPKCLQNLRLLSFLRISFNKFHGVLNLAGLSSLKALYARQFSFQEQFTWSQVALPSSLKYLRLSHITISETLFDNLVELKAMSISNCVLNISTTWIPQFQLEGLEVSSCRVGNQIPEWLVTQYSLQKLKLTNDDIVDEIPSWLWENKAELYVLNLSGNHLHGSLTIPNRSVQLLTVLDVSQNAFTGLLPSVWPQYLQLLTVNDNDLSGNIPLGLCNLIHLVKLDLAKNNFKGSVPPCFADYKVIQVLNLGHNSLEGTIPHGICASSLNVRNNRLSGPFPPSFTDCKSLEILDIGHNMFTGDIPLSVGNLSSLQALMMKGNHFTGRISRELFQLKQLQILDLSSNNISGFIPDNIASLDAMRVAREVGHVMYANLNPYVFGRHNGLKSYSDLSSFDKWVFDAELHDELDMTVKGREEHYPYIFSTLTGIDLSNNLLNGHVPSDIGKLKGLMFLNLSANNFNGVIPQSLGEMGQLESLDLSRNRFSGRIPPQFQSLTSLECLDVSNNNLSGSIPQGGQLMTFENTSYSGNPYLEGCPLRKKCSWPKFAPPLPSINEIQDGNKDYAERISWYWIGLGLSPVAGFCCVILLLAVNSGWREKYFMWVDKILKKLFPSIRHKRI